MSVAANDEGWIDSVAESLGAPGPALRLLLSILMAYPLAIFHRQFLYNKAPVIQHIFFIISGSYMGYFNYGWNILNAYICIGIQYVVLLVSRANMMSVLLMFFFQMTYLLGDYYLTETEAYDIKWTIPHCVLTLRLIGQAFDIYDGTRDDNDLSKDEKQLALRTFPSILESAGHVLYPGSFMIGPQYSMKRYLDFVQGKFLEDGKPPQSIAPGLFRMFLGLSYVAVYQFGSQYINNEYVLSNDFKALALWQKMLVVGLYGKIMLYKYVSCWIVTEGACIMAGMAFNGKNAQGISLWNGCENIHVSLFERAYKFGHIIASFNKCTNLWVGHYVYKRLKFMGNRYISQGAALLFLAVWHGLHSGYYICFFMEFIVMNTEKQLESMLSKNDVIMRWHNTRIGFWIDAVILKVLVTCYFGYCTLSFGLLKFERWWQVYSDLYFNGCIIFGLWPLYAPLVKMILKIGQSPRTSPSHSGSVNGIKTD